MIEYALLTLGERHGSTRQALWKCIVSKYSDGTEGQVVVDYKQFLVRLKKIKDCCEKSCELNTAGTVDKSKSLAKGNSGGANGDLTETGATENKRRGAGHKKQ